MSQPAQFCVFFAAVWSSPWVTAVPCVCCYRLVVAMGYYGLSLNSGTLPGSIFVTFVLGGVVEFPAYTVCFLCFKLGRKWPHVFGMAVGGLACLAMVLVDQFAKGTSPSIHWFCYSWASNLCWFDTRYYRRLEMFFR